MEIGPCSVHVPAEVLSQIVEHVSHQGSGKPFLRQAQVKSIQSIRLVSKAFNIVATPFLVTSAWVSSRKEDHELLYKIARHPVFSKSVRSIYYDATIFDDEFFAWQYHDLFDTSNLVRRDTASSMPMNKNQSHVKYTSDAVERGLELWQEASSLQRSLSSPFMAYSESDDMVDEEFLRIARTKPWPEAREGCFCLDSFSLIDALEHMPNVRELIISDERWERQEKNFITWHQNAGQYRSFTLRELWNTRDYVAEQAVVLDPRRWPDLRSRHPETLDWAWFRSFHVMTHAAHVTKMKLETFAISCQCGLPYMQFSLDELELGWARNAFQHLKYLSLTLITEQYGFPVSFATLLKGQHISNVIGAAVRLERLTLGCMQSYTPINDMALLLGGTIFQHLKCVAFENFSFREGDLIVFLRDHATTLQSVQLNCLPGALSRQESHMCTKDFPFRSCASFMDAFAQLGLDLEYLSLDPCDGCDRAWKSEDPKSIAQFVRHFRSQATPCWHLLSLEELEESEEPEEPTPGTPSSSSPHRPQQAQSLSQNHLPPDTLPL